MQEIFESEFIRVTLDDGLLTCEMKAREEINLEIAKIGADQRIAACNGISYPTIFDITKVKKWDQEARSYLANEKGSECVSASALLVNSPVVKMTGNFFIMVHKPIIPTRLFTDKDSAIQWLSQFKVSE